jgi:L-fuculose-phosphate aldolase
MKQYAAEDNIKATILDIGQRMYAKGLVVAHDGNISCRAGENSLWITPAGASKGFMTEDMLTKTDLKGNVLAGKCSPSSEIKMHLRVYQENPEVQAVIHAHPPVATAFSVAGIALDKPIIAEAVVQLGCVPVAAYATPGTDEVSDSIAPYCKDYQAVLLANHGALTWGDSLMGAYFKMETLEYYATLLMYTKYIIGKANPLTGQQLARLK